MLYICFCVIFISYSDLDGDSLTEVIVVILVRSVLSQKNYGDGDDQTDFRSSWGKYCIEFGDKLNMR